MGKSKVHDIYNPINSDRSVDNTSDSNESADNELVALRYEISIYHNDFIALKT